MVAFAIGLSLAGQVSAADLLVHAAASLVDVLKEIGANYEKESGDKAQFNFGASSMLARQIEEGAPGDIFISADEAKMDALEKKDLLLPGSRRDLLSNTLVIVVPITARDVPTAASDLEQPLYPKLALAQPESVPAGIYAREYLEKLKLWEKLKSKVVPLENVRAALTAVESGDVAAGFVYKTDALSSKKAKVAVEIRDGPPISYPVAVLKSAKDAEKARKLADYLAGSAARQVFEKYGFTMASGPAAK